MERPGPQPTTVGFLFLVGGGGDGKLGKVKTSPSRTIPRSPGAPVLHFAKFQKKKKKSPFLPFRQHGPAPFPDGGRRMKRGVGAGTYQLDRPPPARGWEWGSG